MSKENDPDFVRCVNVKRNTFGYFRKETAYDKAWQRSSGFIPQPLPEAAPTEKPNTKANATTSQRNS